MSDLAAFVAASIRDRVVHELMEENRKLKQENEQLKREKEERCTIRITGTNGTPVYLEKSVKDGRDDGNGTWVVDVPSEDSSCPFNGTDQLLEVWVGGSKICRPRLGNLVDNYTRQYRPFRAVSTQGPIHTMLGSWKSTSLNEEDSASSDTETPSDSVEVRVKQVLFHKVFITDAILKGQFQSAQ